MSSGKSIKSSFNFYIKNFKVPPTRKRKYMTEPDYVHCLLDALRNTYGAAVYHSKILHANPVLINKKAPYSRELCDLLLVIRFPNYLRYSFVQVKMDKGSVPYSLSYSRPFSLDCGQHFLLSTHCDFWSSKMLLNGIHSDLLTAATYDTVSSYSVFFKDASGDYDADFSAADFIICQNQYPDFSFRPCTFHKRQQLQERSCRNCKFYPLLVTKSKKHFSAHHAFSSFFCLPDDARGFCCFDCPCPFPYPKDDLFVENLDALSLRHDIGQPILFSVDDDFSPDYPSLESFRALSKTFVPDDENEDPIKRIPFSDSDHPSRVSENEGDNNPEQTRLIIPQMVVISVSEP